MSDKRTERRQEMALTDASITGEGERGAVLGLDPGDTVKPLRHQLGSAVRKVITGDCIGWIGSEILQVLMGANLDDVFNFFLD